MPRFHAPMQAQANGEQLTELMVDYGVGVSEEGVLELKNLDEDSFWGRT
jgi:restriction endonuclease Mrr